MVCIIIRNIYKPKKYVGFHLEIAINEGSVVDELRNTCKDYFTKNNIKEDKKSLCYKRG